MEDEKGLDEKILCVFEEDYNKILELQLQAAVICDEHPELEEKTGEMFQTVTAENADEVLKQIMEEPDLRDLAKIAVIIFLLRFPSVQSVRGLLHIRVRPRLCAQAPGVAAVAWPGASA